jgi:hypothetical protein
MALGQVRALKNGAKQFSTSSIGSGRISISQPFVERKLREDYPAFCPLSNGQSPAYTRRN